MKYDIPVYEAKIMGTDNTGIFAMSFVDVPANESNFVALSQSAARPVKLSLDKHKQVLTGAVLIPNQTIYRNDTQLGEYYLRFSAEDIEKIRDKMMRTGVALRTTTHQHERPLRDNHLVECWIVQDPKRDKSVALGLGELPKGTLVASYKVGNATYWRSQVLAGKVKGFSIEGLFNFKTVKMSKTNVTAAKGLPGVKKVGGVGLFLRSLAAMLDGDTAAEAKDLTAVAKDDTTGSGTPYIIFELQDGTEIDVDSEGFCTMASDQSQAPAGDHTLADGNTISIGDDGMLVETTDAAEAVEPEAAAAALSAQKKAREIAKAKGLKASAALAAAADKTPQAKKIAALKAQIAALEAEPSTAPARPAVDGGTNVTAATLAKLKGHERAAAMLRAKFERNK